MSAGVRFQFSLKLSQIDNDIGKFLLKQLKIRTVNIRARN